MAKIRRLFADIEVSPNVVLAFRAGYDLNINHDAIIEERRVICIGFKWQGDKKRHILKWDEDQQDKDMLIEFFKIAEQADEIVAHFGAGFDIPWLRARCLILKLDPIPLYKIVDTKAMAKKNFLFNSNKLDYLSRVLGHGGKLHTDFDLWKRVLIDKCPKALAYMCKYCVIDVVKLEAVFLDMERYAKPETHIGVLNGGARWSCPHCASIDVTPSKRRASGTGAISYQFKCECGAYYKVSLNAYREWLKATKKSTTQDTK